MKRLGALLILVAPITSLGLLPATAGATEYEEQATLGDGVEGLDIDRTTPIEAEVWAVEQVGPYMLVGGAFLTVRDRSNYERIERPYLAAFDPTTGEYVPWFRTQTDGPVYDIVDLGDGRAIIAGEFTAVNGMPKTEKVAVIDTATGLVDTSYTFDFNNSSSSVVRALAIEGDWLYLTGGFSSVNAGGKTVLGSGLARISLSTRQADQGWSPRLSGGGGWGIDTSGTGKVFVGGYFSSVNSLNDTETLVAINASNGAVDTAWNNGYPHHTCHELWRETCGAVNGLVVTNGRLFVAGAKHFWAALDVSTGSILADYTISNDGQTVELVDGMVVIGCHCERSASIEFSGISHRYIRIIDPFTLHEVASPTVNSRGGAGGWAAGQAADSCLWAGGNFTSTFINGAQQPAWNLLRFCPTAGRGTNPALPTANSLDTTEPTQPGTPSIQRVAGSSVTLTWAPSSDDSGQLLYLVYRDGELVARTSSNSVVDALIGYDKTSVWQVAASDLSGNMTGLSQASAPVRIGSRVNIAPQGTASQISDYATTTTADLAINGDTTGSGSEDSMARTGTLPPETSSWWALDLGQAQHIDSVALFPRRDAAFQESSNRPRIYQSQLPIDAQSIASANVENLQVWVGNVSRSDSSPRIDVAPISSTVRFLKIFGGYNGRISFAEVEVFTTYPQPTPAAPEADTQPPSDPTWRQTLDRGANSVLSWGGASDNTAVAYYEVYKDSTLIARTPERTVAVGAAGQTSQAFEIIAFDAAGNAGSTPPDTATPVSTCAITRNGVDVDVVWDAPIDVERFVIRRSADGGSTHWRGVVSAPAISLLDTDRDGVLIYTVQAKYTDGGAEATECSVTEIPSGLQATRVTKDRVVLNYGGKAKPVEIERNGIVIAVEGDNWFTDTGLSAAVEYTYRVRFEGSSAWSEPLLVTTEADVVVAPVISTLDSCSWADDGSQIAVSWVGGQDADFVVIQRSIDTGTSHWRGRHDALDGPFLDTSVSGTVLYQARTKTGAELGPLIECQ